jgi:hypothetical protein
MNLNGLRIDRSTDASTIWIPLPRAAWRSCGKCACRDCQGREGFWDTLALASAGPERGKPDTTFTAHRPAGHPFHDRNADGVCYTDPVVVAACVALTSLSE